MKVFEQPAEFRNHILRLKAEGKTIGLVPTMGALHPGHLSLLSQAIAENDVSVASIFVNPLQFNNREDLALYPRTVAQDLAMLEHAGCNLALLPSAESMFEKETKITLDFGALTHELEGKYRPGHFTGVGVVVAKLLNMTWPDKAYFGLKDLQQCAVIQMLVQDLGFPVSLRFVETERESDGLAMSSRNQRLSASGRQKAALIYKTLNQIKQDLKNRLFSEVKIDGLKTLNAAGILEVEYLELVNFETMLPILKPELGNSSVICMAAWVDDVRLIDNIFV